MLAVVVIFVGELGKFQLTDLEVEKLKIHRTKVCTKLHHSRIIFFKFDRKGLSGFEQIIAYSLKMAQKKREFDRNQPPLNDISSAPS